MDASIRMDSLLFALLAEAVADIRRIREAHQGEVKPEIQTQEIRSLGTRADREFRRFSPGFLARLEPAGWRGETILFRVESRGTLSG